MFVKKKVVTSNISGAQFEGDLGKILTLGAKNFALYWSQGEVGVSLKTTKKQQQQPRLDCSYLFDNIP